MLKRLKDLVTGHSSSSESSSQDSFSRLAWIEEGQSPYGVRILDCRSVSRSLLSMTKDASVAQRFAELRSSQGHSHRGRVPANAVQIGCDLRYPHDGEVKDGPVFIAEVMEDKWDIYLYDGYLYFARSWTGDLFCRAKIDFSGEKAVISSVEANPEMVGGDTALAVGQVDFLVKSHIYQREVPHPIPSDLRDDPKVIALFSFSQYGRWASFATYEDTTRMGL